MKTTKILGLGEIYPSEKVNRGTEFEDGRNLAGTSSEMAREVAGAAGEVGEARGRRIRGRGDLLRRRPALAVYSARRRLGSRAGQKELRLIPRRRDTHNYSRVDG